MGELKRAAPNSDLIVLCCVSHSRAYFFLILFFVFFSRKPILYCNIFLFFNRSMQNHLSERKRS